MKIAVTGATGHLGSKVIEHLNKEKQDIKPKIINK